jgi:hypothetical protein
MCQRRTQGAPTGGCACSRGAPVTRSYNYDSAGRALPHPAGYYMIPAADFSTVVARMQSDRRILNCYRFTCSGCGSSWTLYFQIKSG